LEDAIVKPFAKRLTAALAIAGQFLQPIATRAEDIDLFVSGTAVSGLPNVLFVLDNTSNWARQSQQWPGGIQQGQSEVRAIKAALDKASLAGKMNVGLMEFVTEGNANNDGGYVRHAIKLLDGSTNSTALFNKLNAIDVGINDPIEKRNSNTAYGNWVYDVYNYLVGGTATDSGAGTPALRDAAGYDTVPSKFKSPFTDENVCGNTYVIYLTNPNSSGPATDESANSTALKALYTGVGDVPRRLAGDSAGTPLELPNFSMTTVTDPPATLGTSSCLPETTGCATAIAAYPGCSDGTYASCSCNNLGAGGCSGTPPTLLGTTSCVLQSSQCSSLGALPAACTDGTYTSCTCTDLGTSGCNATPTPVATYSCENKNNTCVDEIAKTAGCTNGDYTNCTCTSTSTGCTGGKKNWTVTGTPVLKTFARYGNSTNLNKFEVVANNYPRTVVTPTNTYDTTSGADFNFDDWAKFLYQHGVPYGSGPNAYRAKVVTYTIDVFNAQQNNLHTSLMLSAANNGGGRYFAAKNQDAIIEAIETALSEILAKNSAFASAALPVTTTNRSQNENQVYVPMFLPNPQTKPRWFGNLKRYEIGYVGGIPSLIDRRGTEVAATGTGFVNECAVDHWTGDPPTSALTKADGTTAYKDYWSSRFAYSLDGNTAVAPDPKSQCATVPEPATVTDPDLRYNDSPDGPWVMKGGVSLVLRKGNTGTNGLVNRTVYTLNSGGTALAAFNTTSSGLSANLVNFTLGKDVGNANGNKTSEDEARIDIHGDVTHSRPLPINYGGSSKPVTVYYGANDGMLRAIDAATGQEQWAFIAPEHFGKLQRLYDNKPNIRFPNQPADVSAGNLPKDYFFDGSLGAIVYYGNETIPEAAKAWIYATMRRGGRMIYAFDVTNRTSPTFLWRLGCRDATDGNCADGAGGSTTAVARIGQTWSVPTVGRIKGYTKTVGTEVTNPPVLVVGGGYDDCEDTDAVTTTCTADAKGRVVYVLDAETGAVLNTISSTSFVTDGSVPSEISLVDYDQDGFTDFGYLSDTRGNVYRIDFVDPATNAARAAGAWTMTKVAYTSGGGRKFLYGPETFNVGVAVYLALGSGNRERPLQINYPYASDVQDRFYVMMDQPQFWTNSSTALNLDNLTNAASSDTATAATCDTELVQPGTTKKGWMYDYTHRGEQTVTSALINLGVVIFSTSGWPTQAQTDLCAYPLGQARSYRLNLLNGSGAASTPGGKCGEKPFVNMEGVGIPPSPVLATVGINVNGEVRTETVVIGAGEKGIGSVTQAKPNPKPTVKRKYFGSSVAD
jgi:Tfp pilus tip-associated adhesin PilY1